ncbi:dimethyladenosine transferase [Thermoanaerobacterium thermosaccharolyticum DSM 571]|uniref:Ribosomal RNA small subunit methyltransferase A n=1 Tax=Thermoanaerobacterium thermosaccharolyticum (strain ATCC 7956 / DSM 571 / NCIMB 9385 / NCA 3814 / NCTC 13789 / WDCM 00135 / 2032) TaxID=580327 RepID=D9TNF5_THETC|nr:16S rRNA (adenine(1518)-N(6)/adenine(1519)-N(6))-dimethyltransferase RsmA [Thermoanaerobacterium thermosaccharolyticum]ADL67698.1 dimethyladenosine transferase [Thermoanaerobacterium thermosaccharolyticum DSM 571]
MRVKGFNTKKKLGQNFIFDEGILSKIADLADITKDDNVIEIGAGLGTLTREIVERAKNVVAYEIDDEAVGILRDKLREYKNLIILNDDIMKADLKGVVDKYFDGDKCKVVANLPYYITSPIIMKLLESHLMKDITILIQKEVAERICAEPGSKEYGVLTVAVNYYSKPEMLLELPPEVFSPKPKVSSTLIKLHVLDEPPVFVKNEKLFFKVVKASFGQRRKVITNSLKSLNIDQSLILNALLKCGIDLKQRGETLSIEKFAELANAIDDMKM